MELSVATGTLNILWECPYCTVKLQTYISPSTVKKETWDGIENCLECSECLGLVDVEVIGEIFNRPGWGK